MAAFIRNGIKCSTHMQCLSGYCKEGACRPSEKYYPCRRDCPAGFLCHESNRHCLPVRFQSPAQCKFGSQCPWGRYCEAGICKLKRSVGSSCVNHSECAWEAACHEGRCILKCLENKECPKGEKCRSIPGLSGFSGCMARPRKNPAPGPAPIPAPAIGPVSPKKGASFRNFLEVLKGSVKEHYKLYIALSVALLLLVVVIWIIIRKMRRRKAQATTSILDDAAAMASSSPLAAESVYVTQPTAPLTYNHVSTVQGTPYSSGTAPPTYQEIYGGERDTGAGVSAGEGSPMPSPYEKL